MAAANRSNKILKLAIVVSAVFVLVGTFLFYVFQSGLFRERVRSAIVSSLSEATGGEVTLGGFQFNWSSFTARLDRLTIRGASDRRSPALFTAATVTIQFRVTSFFRRQADLESMQVAGATVYLLVRPDGTTNIPLVPGRSPVADLLNLRVRHLEFQHGMLLLNERRIPLDVRAGDFHLLLSADRRLTRYAAQVSAQSITADAFWARSIAPQLTVDAELAKDSLHVRQLVLATARSRLELAGDLTHFLNPQARFRFHSTVAAPDLAQSLPELESGTAELSGDGQYRSPGGLALAGEASLHGLAYRARIVSLRNAQASSHFRVSNDGLRLDDLVAEMRGAHFQGTAEWLKFRAMTLEGRFGGIGLQEVASAAARGAFPWSGTAAGSLRVSGDPRKWRDLQFETQLQIAPALGPIPVSGNLSLRRSPNGDWDFANSTVDGPNTHVAFAGRPNQQVSGTVDTTDFGDLLPALGLLQVSVPAGSLPRLQPGGQAHFAGTVAGRFPNVAVAGNVAFTHVTFDGRAFDRVRSDLALSPAAASFESLSADAGPLHATAKAEAALTNWKFESTNVFKLQAQFSGVDLAAARAAYPELTLPLSRGVATGNLNLSGTAANPLGNGTVTVTHAQVAGEEVARVQSDFLLQPTDVLLSKGRAEAAAGVLQFSGSFHHAPGEWQAGRLRLDLSGSGLRLAKSGRLHAALPTTDAQIDLRGSGSLNVAGRDVTLTQLDGDVAVRKISSEDRSLGNIAAHVVTAGETVKATLNGDLEKTHLSGSAAVALVDNNPVKGSIQIDRIDLATLYSFLPSAAGRTFPFTGYTKGAVDFSGSLEHPDAAQVEVRLDTFQMQSSVPVGQSDQPPQTVQFQLENPRPIVVDIANGVARIRAFQLEGSNTALQVTGYSGLVVGKPLAIDVHGTVDMQVLQALDPNVKSTGLSVVNASLSGTVGQPAIGGTLDLKNASFFPRDFPNGLSAVNGTLTFDGERATIQKLTAQSGGGQLALTGFISYGRSGPLVYHLDGRADDVRVRYANGISVTASSDLRLSGTSESSLLSGSVTVSRVVLNPSTDVGNLLAGFAATSATPANQKDFLTGLHLDIAIESAPNLQLSTALSRDVEAEIDLRLRGTPDHPIVLGSVAANQGDIRVFGTRYSINRGEISFVNTIKLDPVLDLDLQTEARGITVDITISGTINKLNITYRSDPPLQPRDIIALLTVGRAPDVASNIQNVQVANDSSALQSGANTVLGQAFSPVSNRLSKLFGITNLKIDPLVQGITNTPQARLTLEQQISRDITVTYITNLSQTSEQIFRVEWALTRQYSVVALRDENGEFGIDFQYKKRFK